MTEEWNHYKLDDFGKLITHEVRDQVLDVILSAIDGNDEGRLGAYHTHIQRVSPGEREALQKLVFDSVDNCLAMFLDALDDGKHGFYLRDDDGEDIIFFSDGIGIEPSCPGGWNERYSRFDG